MQHARVRFAVRTSKGPVVSLRSALAGMIAAWFVVAAGITGQADASPNPVTPHDGESVGTPAPVSQSVATTASVSSDAVSHASEPRASLDFAPDIAFDFRPGLSSTTLAAIEPAAAQPRFPMWQQQQQGSSWSFGITPYLWFAGLDGDQSIDGLDGEQGTDFGDAIDELDFTPGVRVEASNGQWGVLVDAALVDISDSSTQEGSRVDVDTEIILVDMMVLFTLTQSESFEFSLTGGGRYTHADAKVKVRGGSRESTSEDWFDPTIGVRLGGPLSDGLDFVVRGDYGGFNIGSGDDRTWQVVGEVMYDIGGGSRLGLGYRHLVQEYEEFSNSSSFEWDQELSGPMVVLLLGM